MGLNNLSLTNASYSSTTNVPKGEPKLIEQLLKAAEELYKKLDKDLADIRSVGEGFATMDNFLEGQSIDLGFQVASAKVSVVDLSQYAATSLDHLLEKEVPIVEGYNDQFGKKKGGEDDDGGGNGSGGNGGGGGGGNSTPTPVATEPKTEGRTEGKTEPMSEPTSETDPEEQTEPVSEVTTEVPSEVASEVKTEPTTSAPVEQKTEPSEKKPTGGTNKKPTGGTNKKPKNTNTETKPTETPIVDPNLELPTEVINDEPVIIDEPYVEPEVEPEIIIDEPSIINLDENTIPEETPKKSNTGRVVAGVITGLGLAGGAAAGYGYYKKKQEDKEYEDYGYEEGEDE